MKNKEIFSLYIHIPFCKHLCGYCDFPKLLINSNWEDRYISALFDELDSYKVGKMKTIYIGGGTPTSLNERNLSRLLEKVGSYLDDGGEFTIEINPETMTDKKFDIIASSKINRVSIGIQSSHENRLNEMGRQHTFNDASKCIHEFRERGIDNINVDLIYGLKGETLDELQDDIDHFLKLGTQHISTYCLSVAPGTSFFNHGYAEADEDEAADQYELILQNLRNNGYIRYEVSNYAKPGFESKHNLTYWKDCHYYGVGLGASGYIGNIRYDNTKNLDEYLKGNYLKQQETIDANSRIEYYLITNLRLAEGFSIDEFIERFGEEAYINLNKKIKEKIENGLMAQNDGRIFATDRGLLILNRLLVDLI